jgi:hypothetical protein
MNDFSKEELKILYHCAKFVTEYNWLHDKYDGIMYKIRSIIDNYCEHDYRGNTQHCNDCGVSEYKCNDCGHVSYEGLE